MGQRVQVACKCRTQGGEPVPSPTPVGYVAHPVLPENLFIPPLFLVHLGSIFSQTCYSDCAKFETEEMTHVIHLALVRLDLENGLTPSFFFFFYFKSQRQQPAEETASTYLIIGFCMLLYMPICKFIININVYSFHSKKSDSCPQHGTNAFW